MYEYVGNIHIHSTYSDGGEKIPQIASWAAQAGLDFIVITDHKDLEGLKRKEEGYFDGVLVLVGMEINSARNHYLALDITEVVEPNDDNPQEVINQVNNQNGIGIIAHPFDRESALLKKFGAYPWTDWTVRGFQGIEIWNFLSQWREGITSYAAGLYLLLNPHAALKGPDPQALQFYDRCQQTGIPIVAFGSSDAHGSQVSIGPYEVTIAPYQLCFKCINMHIWVENRLSRDLKRDKPIIYQALRNGCSSISYDYYLNSKGFRFYMEREEKKCYPGGRIKADRDLLANVITPYPAEVWLVKNGQKWKKSTGRMHRFVGISDGVYRVEVFHQFKKGLRPWIFTNSIQVY
ncbi:MAG: PHP domain-containing protein [Syntrophomonadaceae bacterium]|jgi:hypothetical protein